MINDRLKLDLSPDGTPVNPGAGGSVSVTRRVGRHRAAWLMLTGERLNARTALEWGLVDEISSCS